MNCVKPADYACVMLPSRDSYVQHFTLQCRVKCERTPLPWLRHNWLLQIIWMLLFPLGVFVIFSPEWDNSAFLLPNQCFCFCAMRVSSQITAFASLSPSLKCGAFLSKNLLNVPVLLRLAPRSKLRRLWWPEETISPFHRALFRP